MENNYSKKIQFPNGWGASVISHSGRSYGGDEGLFEVAVINKDGSIDYGTPITDDVIGWLDFNDVVKVLEQIKNLPQK